jgi:arylsulfatase A-like enzyme
MNIVVVVFDTLRQDHVGAYGNSWIVTPHLDEFARDAVRFTRAYPESLPTLLFRRALHTGLRTYPFHGHREYKGEFPGVAPGWGPIPEEQDTVAEILGPSGYRSALITDTYHQFKPSKNFHRGFDEWIWVRGQELDRYRSGPAVSPSRIQSHMNEPAGDHPGLAKFLGGYLRNNNERLHESDYYPAQVFSEASRWLWDNQDAANFFLVVDSFDPHEPWDPPVWYRKLYDPDDDVADIIQSPYCPWQETLTPRELKRVQANYAGEVTMTDRWFGQFMETLKLTGRLEDTVVVVMSDHGHNLGFDPGDKGMVSKQGHPMTHAVADLVLMMRHPSGEGAGSKCDQLVYNHDVVATVLSMAGQAPPSPIDGRDFWPALGPAAPPFRDYVTIAWGPLVTVITDEWWFNASVWGEGKLLYAVRDDPALERNLAGERPDVCEDLLRLAIEDAGGEIPEAFANYHNKPGCTPFEDIRALLRILHNGE